MARTRMKIARQTLIDHLQQMLDEAQANWDAKVAAYEEYKAKRPTLVAEHKAAVVAWHRKLARAIAAGDGVWSGADDKAPWGVPRFTPNDESLRNPPEFTKVDNPNSQHSSFESYVFRTNGWLSVSELKADLAMLRLAVDENLTLTAEDFSRYYGR